MPRGKSFDIDEALNKAMEIFWDKGYESASLADLTEGLGIGKGSFYATFKSKENLFNLCIERYTDLNFPFLDQVLSADKDYKRALRKLLEDYINGLLQDENRKGCFMANSCGLVHGDNPDFGIKIAEHYYRIEKYFQRFLVGRGVSEAKASSISATIITFLIGASQQSKINRDKGTYLASVDNIIGLLD